MLVRAVTPLFIKPEPSGARVHSPVVAESLRVATEVSALLLAAGCGPLRADGEGERYGLADDELETAVAQLLKLGFLVPCEPEDETPERPAPWDALGDAAWLFHEHSRNTPHVVPETDRDRYRPVLEEIASRPQPPAFTPHDSDRPVLLLPRVHAPMSTPYAEVLENRRTHREFTGRPVNLDAFATLLHYSFAPLRFSDAGLMGVVQLRAAASAGARHETDACVAVFDVEGVEPGVYRYDTVRHGLVPVTADVSRAALEELTYHQGLCTTAGFVVVTVAVSARIAWKYRHPRTYRDIFQDTGHVAQVFSMTATALSLGAAITGAFQDDELDQLLGLRSPQEFATFVMACGTPRTRDDGTPLDHTAPSAPWSLR